MTLDEFNSLATNDCDDELSRCCGASRWVAAIAKRRPFADPAALHSAADDAWAAMQRADILEAFSHHPQIGADIEALRKRFAGTATWSAGEQAGVKAATEATLVDLVEGNREYLAKFGYIFIVCATGKSAAKMLDLLRTRLGNDPDNELTFAAAEQAKIMHIRLDKLLALQSTA